MRAIYLVPSWFVSEVFYRYVAKIIFTYILGYKVDVGHMEAVNLISSSRYSEKQIVCYAFISSYLLSNLIYAGLFGCYTPDA